MKYSQAAVLPVALLGTWSNVVAQSTASSISQSASVATSTASPTGAPDSPLPSQAPLPPKQAWCPSEIFCAGEILQSINIARPYSDSKTIVDKPTTKATNTTIAAYRNYTSNGLTYGEVTQFLDSYFQGEGLELKAVSVDDFPQNPASLSAIPNQYVQQFLLAVHQIWDLLIRDTDQTTLCAGGNCESSLIPLNHTFVVPGGRFREQYYWDSKFILHGLLESELYGVANSTLQNFMDEIERFGFIPNGGRIYYLNRSQPPVFINMVAIYVNKTQDVTILERALPLMEAELSWWETNRTIKITSPYSYKTFTMTRYAVDNSAPRPESYLEDYEAGNGADLVIPYTDQQKADLYAELASGAETGWDYSSRWEKNPFPVGGNLTNNTPGLRTLNVRSTIPVDLNSILYQSRIDLANLYDLSAGSYAKHVRSQAPSDRAAYHREVATTLRAGILDLFWDEKRLAFYDFNLTANARNTQFTAAHWYPLWANIIPDEILSSKEKAFGAFASLNFAMRRYNGTYPATFLETGLQWDFPNSWPPHIYFALEALTNLCLQAPHVTGGDLPVSNNSFTLIPTNQLGLTEDQVPLQTLGGNLTAPRGSDINTVDGTVTNGGNKIEGEGWASQLQRELANRYMTSVFCSWYATGGSLPGLLPRLPDATLNLTKSIGQTGNLFEKFSALDSDSSGRGGEYVVQAGFGWTNGVALWVGANFKDVLVQPNCPPIADEIVNTINLAGGTANVLMVNTAFALLTCSIVIAGLSVGW